MQEMQPCPDVAQTERQKEKEKERKKENKVLTLLAKHSQEQSAPKGAPVEKQEKKLSMIESQVNRNTLGSSHETAGVQMKDRPKGIFYSLYLVFILDSCFGLCF